MAGIWRRFRGLTPLAQLAVSIVATLVVVSPFASAAEEPAPSATTAVAPPTTVASTTTTTTTSSVPPAVPARGEDSSVVRVIDGDTIEVAGATRVRLIGVDTPETGTCFGSEATRYANELLPAGTKIRLVYDAAPTTRATIARLVPPAEPAAGGCHPSYSGACVPTSFSDVDCPDINGKRFQVVGPDVYRLDADKDGVACES